MVLQVENLETKFSKEEKESKESEELRNITYNLNYLASLEKDEYLFVVINNRGKHEIQCKYSKGWWKTLDDTQKKDMTKLTNECIKYCIESSKEKKILGINNKKVMQGVSNFKWTLRSNSS